MVVLDRDSQQLVLENNDDLELAECPYCHRPLHDPTPPRRESHHATQPEFVNPNYFRMLRNTSLLPSSVEAPPSSSSSPPPSSSASPRRRRVRPALAEGSSGPDESSSSAQHSISSAAFSQGYFKRFFVEESVLGRGGKGVVLLVKHVLDGVSLGHYACKRVPVGDHHDWLERVLVEVQLLQHLSHQNLVSYRHVWLEDAQITRFGPSVPCAFILQQYCNAGDLHNYVCGLAQQSASVSSTQQLKDRLRRRSKGDAKLADDIVPRRLPLEEIFSFFKDITSGLRYLHLNGYIHRDLKPSNCLLHQTNEGLRVLVSDFGEAQSQDAIRRSSGSTGTVSYCAPEVLQREYPGGPFGNFTYASDIFSLGMILYFLCFAQLPYRNANIMNEENEDLEQLREEIADWNGLDDILLMRPDLPEQLYAYLQQLLSVDPARRPSAHGVLNGIQSAVNGENFRFKAATTTSTGSDTRRSSRASPGSSTSGPMGMQRHGQVVGSSNNADFGNGVSHQQEQNMIIRHRFSPFSSSSSPQQRDRGKKNKNNNINRQQLLPPPARHVSPNANSVLTGHLVQLALFSLKIVTAFQPCSPLAARPLVFYPLLLFAALNLGIRNIKIQFFALAVHLLAVGLSIRFDVLCVGN